MSKWIRYGYRGQKGKSKRAYGRLYCVWLSMRKRCLRPSHPDYPEYGGRGITLCAEWCDYANFRKWAISHGYRKGLQINRIDNDESYFPENCHWATPAEQCLNKRSTHIVTWKNQQIPLPQFARMHDVCIDELRSRHKRLGWSLERCLAEATRPYTGNLR